MVTVPSHCSGSDACRCCLVGADDQHIAQVSAQVDAQRNGAVISEKPVPPTPSSRVLSISPSPSFAEPAETAAVSFLFSLRGIMWCAESAEEQLDRERNLFLSRCYRHSFRYARHSGLQPHSPRYSCLLCLPEEYFYFRSLGSVILLGLSRLTLCLSRTVPLTFGWFVCFGRRI